MKRLECPMDGCSATIEAETEEEVMTQAEEHARSSHPDMEMDEETTQNIRSKIVDV